MTTLPQHCRSVHQIQCSLDTGRKVFATKLVLSPDKDKRLCTLGHELLKLISLIHNGNRGHKTGTAESYRPSQCICLPIVNDAHALV